MKGTETFKKTIQDYLIRRGAEDPLFAITLQKENKNIDECLNYIFQEVQKSNMNGFADEEIYKMAVHYYDEDDLTASESKAVRVVVNHHVELTEEEKEEMKKRALDEVLREQKAILTKKKTKPVVQNSEEKPASEQLGLF